MIQVINRRLGDILVCFVAHRNNNYDSRLPVSLSNGSVNATGYPTRWCVAFNVSSVVNSLRLSDFALRLPYIV